MCYYNEKFVLMRDGVARNFFFRTMALGLSLVAMVPIAAMAKRQ